jgi:Protein of unknown function (DUF2442)/Domain of unknown function (DUF4160)
MTDVQGARAQQVIVTADTLNVALTDGRTIAVPLSWYPRLVHGTPEERNHWRFIGQGEGIHWPALDEDISVENLLSGKVSGESQRSLQQRIEQRLGRMPMPQICEFFGVGIYMYYNDHRPPHLHALYAEHEALFAINTLEILQGELPRRPRAFIVEWASLHREELRANWD